MRTRQNRVARIGLAIYAVTAFALFPALVLAQRDSTPRNVAEQVLAIRKQFTRINAEATRYTQKERDLSGFSAEGGTLVGYYNKSDLQKIVATYYGETGKVIDEFYFAKGALIFALSTDLTYKGSLHDQAYKSVAFASTTQNRYYFNEGRLIQWLLPNKTAHSLNTASARKAEKERIADAAVLRKRLNERSAER